MYTVDYSKQAAKELQKLDFPTTDMIYGWVEKNLVGCSDPRRHGKPLTGDKKGYWRYRVGSYRLIAEIDDGRVRIFLVHIAHRREIYS